MTQSSELTTDVTTWPPPTMVLTAGVGSRLHPLSHLKAKAALPVAGVPLIRRILARLRAQGVRDVVLNLHHRPETIAAIVGDGSDIGLRVRYSWEPRLLGSAGGVARALPLLDAGHLLIVNGDSLTDLDLRTVWDAHLRWSATVTMALAPFPAPGRYGGVMISADGVVTGFRRRSEAHVASDSRDAWHYIGVQVVQRALLASVPTDEPLESVRDLYPTLLTGRQGAVRGFVSGAAFLDTGTVADYLHTSLELAATEGGRPALIGRGCRVAASASLVDSILWDDVSVGTDCKLTRCVVTDRVNVPPGSRYESSILMRHGDCPGDVKARVDGELAVVEL
ncbi:MAG: sugar phosphate nucleotidyltransferase [Vicinamibacteraceae bacterium]